MCVYNWYGDGDGRGEKYGVDYKMHVAEYVDILSRRYKYVHVGVIDQTGKSSFGLFVSALVF